MDGGAVRRLWYQLETIHAVTYFAAEVQAAMASIGLRGFWMGYMASRAAPLGPVGPAPVEAAFYNFHPKRVRRALPEAWRLASPEVVLAARLHAVDQALWRLVGEELRRPDVAVAAELARRAAEAADCGGRVLAAAYQSLDWPTVPHLVLWQAATVLREHRGDGHVAALVASRISGLEAHVLAVALGAADAEFQQTSRGWTPQQWDAAIDSCRRRRWLDDAGQLTEKGWTVKGRLEAQTDRLAVGPLRALEEGEVDRLAAVTERLARAIAATGTIPFPNPMALPAPADW